MNDINLAGGSTHSTAKLKMKIGSRPMFPPYLPTYRTVPSADNGVPFTIILRQRQGMHHERAYTETRSGEDGFLL